MEFIIAEVEGGVDGFEGLKIDVYLALFAFGGDYFAAVDDKAVRGNFVVEFKALLGGCDGGEDGEAVDAGLDVGGGTLWYSTVSGSE